MAQWLFDWIKETCTIELWDDVLVCLGVCSPVASQGIIAGLCPASSNMPIWGDAARHLRRRIHTQCGLSREPFYFHAIFSQDKTDKKTLTQCKKPRNSSQREKNLVRHLNVNILCPGKNCNGLKCVFRNWRTQTFELLIITKVFKLALRSSDECIYHTPVNALYLYLY